MELHTIEEPKLKLFLMSEVALISIPLTTPGGATGLAPDKARKGLFPCAWLLSGQFESTLKVFPYV